MSAVPLQSSAAYILYENKQKAFSFKATSPMTPNQSGPINSTPLAFCARHDIPPPHLLENPWPATGNEKPLTGDSAKIVPMLFFSLSACSGPARKQFSGKALRKRREVQAGESTNRFLASCGYSMKDTSVMHRRCCSWSGWFIRLCDGFCLPLRGL